MLRCSPVQHQMHDVLRRQAGVASIINLLTLFW